MAKKIKGGDKITDTTLHELLLMMDAKLNHIEDISADNRAVIIKLVQQSNQIVEFLKQLELEIDEVHSISPPEPENTLTLPKEKLEELQSLFEDFQSRSKDLKEFEKELKKHKDKLTPGQMGES